MRVQHLEFDTLQSYLENWLTFLLNENEERVVIVTVSGDPTAALVPIELLEELQSRRSGCYEALV